jgi:glycine/D-amino acid oxidase-like deaminating enzyme
MRSYDDLSLWHWSMDAAAWPRRAPLHGDTAVDVAIVGGGLTGLWTAYYLRRADPTLRIAVVEAEVCGFGASGRNGGWCSALLPMSFDTLAAKHSRDAAMRMYRAMFATVDEVGRVAALEGIDCDFTKGGTLQMARNGPQQQRGQAEVAEAHSQGFSDDDVRWLDENDAAAHCHATRVRGAVYTPHCAAIHPAKLVRGLAEVAERSGVTIYESTRVRAVQPPQLVTDHGTLTADVIVRATEAFTADLPGGKRTIAPIYSLMIATEPLDTATLDAIGLEQRETFNDLRHLVIYGQRTADGRLAFGGRGAPYHFGSSIDAQHERHRRVHDGLATTLRDLFPVLNGVEVTHHWGGPVGIPRDWWCSVNYDRANGVASAGGYVGDGVGTTNLAGRTLADLITGATGSDIVSLPWVDHHSRKWEPEPLRWLGINTMVRLPAGADRAEDRTDRPERLRTALLGRVTGH